MKKLLSLLLAFSMIFALAALGSVSALADGGREITIGTTEQPGGFDRVGTHGNSTVVVYQPCWDSLFVINPHTKEVDPLMVDTYEWIDNTSLHLVLKEGITSDSGEPITADDVIYSIERFIDENSRMASYYAAYDLEKTRAELSSPDATDFVLYYKYEYGPGLSYLNFPVYPKDWCTEGAGAEDGPWWDAPDATGPYRCVENIDGSQTVYELRDNYYMDTTGYPEKITLKYYSEQTALFTDYATGTLDAAFGLASGDVEAIQAGSVDDTTVVIAPKNDVYALTLCPYTEYFQDENVRLAIAHAIDVAGVTEAAFGILGTPATSTLPAGVNYYTNVGAYEYDLDLAREYLAKSPWPDGFTLDTVVTTNDAPTVAIATTVQAYLSMIGIDMQFESYAVPIAVGEYFVTGITQCSFKNCMEGAPSLDPDQIYDTIGYRSTNIAATVSTDPDDEFNTHLYKALGEIDPEARAEDYAFVQQYLKDTAIQIPLVEASYGYCYRDSVFADFEVVSPSTPNFRFVTFAE